MWRLLPCATLAACSTPPVVAETAPSIPTSDSVPVEDTAHPCGRPAVALDLGAEAVMVHGIQGGWHIDVGGVITGLGPIVALHAGIVRLSDGLQLAGDQQPKAIELAGPCGGEFAGLQALIDDHAPGVPYQEFICSLAGETLRVELDVTDLEDSDRVALDAVEVVAVPDPVDPCP